MCVNIRKTHSRFWPKWNPVQLNQNKIDRRKPESAIRLLNRFLKRSKAELQRAKNYFERSLVKDDSDSESESEDEVGDDPMQYIRQFEIHQAIIRIASGEKKVHKSYSTFFIKLIFFRSLFRQNTISGRRENA